MIKKCIYCGNEYNGREDQLYCSNKCGQAYRRNVLGKKKEYIPVGTRIGKCVWCGNDFEYEREGAMYCSKRCYLDYRKFLRTQKEKHKPKERVCEECSTVYIPTANNQRYCCAECRKIVISRESKERWAEKKAKENKKCRVCGKTLDVLRGGRVYCSDECKRAYYLKCRVKGVNIVQPIKQNEKTSWDSEYGQRQAKKTIDSHNNSMNEAYMRFKQQLARG